jgi:hypothetical protein
MQLSNVNLLHQLQMISIVFVTMIGFVIMTYINQIKHRTTNDQDVFCLNTQNMFHSNTPLFTNDDSDARSTIQTSYNVESIFLASFSNMGNVHQIISWLCANPSILLLAYNLYLSMQTPVAKSFNLVTLNFNSSTLATSIPQASMQEDRVNVTFICFVILSLVFVVIA